MARKSKTGTAQTGTDITVALAGNPNAGKTTIFNGLTGERQHVGNYPGVTVEKREGWFKLGEHRIRVIDLPGTLSLTAHTLEERVARNFIIEEQPDVVVDIVDASNLERNLYLATQVMELGVPLILVFNKSDLAKARGYEIDTSLLEKLLNVRIVPTVAPKKKGINELKNAILEVCDAPVAPSPAVIPYGNKIEGELEHLTPLLEGEDIPKSQAGSRWLAVKLLEKDEEVVRWVRSAVAEPGEILSAVEAAEHRIMRDFGDRPEVLLADHRYGFISGACQEAVRTTVEARHSLSDQVDTVLTHPTLGIPIFLGMMYLVFKLTFTLGEAPMHWIEHFFVWLGSRISTGWPGGAESPLLSLVVDGVIGGVGGVVVFLPNILLLFLAIAILEDSGYMARAAFIMDRLMHKIGLHGKSFIPLLIGFGCSVPAIMATRTIEGRRDRLTTMLVTPLMSCGARLPIYAMIIPAFFPSAWRAPILWIIYLIGIVLAVAAAKVLRMTILRGESEPFVMELPPYRLPTVKGVLIHMWDRGWFYLKKAGTLILAISIVMWALMSYPALPAEAAVGSPEEVQARAVAHSVAGRIGHGLEPILKPMGFDWRIGTALIGAFVAKEVFVSQMGVVFAVGEADATSVALRQQLHDNYTPLVGLCIMLFMLVSMPCMATVAATRAESGSWKWALLQLGSLTILAYIITVAVYQVGSLLGLGV
jgi:ferrous iron transport protein B